VLLVEGDAEDTDVADLGGHSAVPLVDGGNEGTRVGGRILERARAAERVGKAGGGEEVARDGDGESGREARGEGVDDRGDLAD